MMKSAPRSGGWCNGKTSLRLATSTMCNPHARDRKRKSLVLDVEVVGEQIAGPPGTEVAQGTRHLDHALALEPAEQRVSVEAVEVVVEVDQRYGGDQRDGEGAHTGRDQPAAGVASNRATGIAAHT